ncbi:MAG: NADH-quinone oxidoreductase subunit A [Candidatus Marsarchaeota archaeon]|nr:NADH-quinone oxidoreductase subunit A [Candidatus Marsarchaeota archaeon]
MYLDYYNYIALVIFAAFALFVPFSYLLTSRMLRYSKGTSALKNSPYESAEKTIGTGRDVENEYLPFFAIFLPFEIMGILILLWAISARELPTTINIAAIGIAALSMVFAIIAYKITSGKNV